MVVIALGRRVRPRSRIPRSAAWAARKRKSIDCAFSLLRAWGERRLAKREDEVAPREWREGVTMIAQI